MYIVYNIETTKSLFWKSYGGVKTFKSEGAAKAAITREIKKREKKNDAYDAWIASDRAEGWLNKPDARIDREDYAIAECEEFAKNIEKWKNVRNLLSGKIVRESVNMPRFLSVSSEQYWSS